MLFALRVYFIAWQAIIDVAEPEKRRACRNYIEKRGENWRRHGDIERIKRVYEQLCIMSFLAGSIYGLTTVI